MARAFLVVIGGILLLPGLCALGLLADILTEIGSNSPRDIQAVGVYWIFMAMVTGLIAWGGAAMIRAGLRPRPPEPPK